MKILMSGSSGLVGSALKEKLEHEGHTVTSLTRDGEVNYDSSPDSFEHFDAVIHLAGKNIASCRWTEENKKAFYASRIETTRKLVEKLNQLKFPPHTFICASAIGFYGNRADASLDETSGTGDTFLAKLTCDWEEVACGYKHGRVVLARFGLVLSTKGGALAKMLTPTKFGMGTIMGSGEQWVSWIAMNDLTQNMCEVIQDHSIEGPVNFCAPNPVRQKEFMKVLGSALHRPVFMRAPAWALRLFLGDMVDEMLLLSSCVTSRKLHQFESATLCAAFKKLLQQD